MKFNNTLRLHLHRGGCDPLLSMANILLFSFAKQFYPLFFQKSEEYLDNFRIACHKHCCATYFGNQGGSSRAGSGERRKKRRKARDIKIRAPPTAISANRTRFIEIAALGYDLFREASACEYIHIYNKGVRRFTTTHSKIK